MNRNGAYLHKQAIIMVQDLHLSPDDQLKKRFITMITNTELRNEVNFTASQIILGPTLILFPDARVLSILSRFAFSWVL